MERYITKIQAVNKLGSGGPLKCLFFLLLILALSLAASAQKVAVLSPDRSEKSIVFAEKLSTQLGSKLRVLDNDLSHAAYLSAPPESPFNLTAEESKRIGAAIGSDALVFVRSVNQRRSAAGRSRYYEAYSVVYLVSTRTGRLNWWKLSTFEAPTLEEADILLTGSIDDLSTQAAARIRSFASGELNEPIPPAMEEVPEDGTHLAKNFRAPVPYKRIKPEYTAAASFYEVSATVEALVDLDAAGEVRRVEITRWAGFGLDESVEAAIRKMNWRPAERNGRTLPMRILLRYNFKKLDKGSAN